MTTVFITLFEHRHGHDLAVFDSLEAAEAYKDNLAEDYWDEVNEGLEEGDPEYIPMPETNKGNHYFQIKGESATPEYFSITKTHVRSLA